MPLASNRKAGTKAPRSAARSPAVLVMMADSLKPTPVSVTTPTMMPTVAAAAPTLMAYLAPITKASTMSTKRALAGRRPRSTYQAETAMRRGDDRAEARPLGQLICEPDAPRDRRQQGDGDDADCGW